MKLENYLDNILHNLSCYELKFHLNILWHISHPSLCSFFHICLKLCLDKVYCSLSYLLLVILLVVVVFVPMKN